MPKKSTIAQLLRSLELIQHEITTMEDALRDAPRDQVTDADRHTDCAGKSRSYDDAPSS